MGCSSLGYLEQLVEWQRNASALEPSADNPREIVFEDALKQNALHVLQSGFKFARVEANLHPADTTAADSADTSSPHARLRQRAEETDQAIAKIHQQLTQSGLPASQRQTLQDQLKLALAKQELFQAVLSNINAATSDTTKSFTNRISKIERSIPELNDTGKSSATPATSAPAAPTPAAHPAKSIMSLSGDLFGIARKQRSLEDFTAQTVQLETNSHAMMQNLRTALDEITGGEADKSETSAPLSVDQQVAQYKQIATIIIPLGDATLWVTTSKATLADWHQALEDRFKTLLRQLGIQLAILGATLAIPVIASEMARRAIARYVGDKKRQRQLNTARRIVTAIAIFLILLLNFISDFSSFATFAGFLTAGLAVALQGVLLSLVAHFFFYGRYGVRRGDRVQVDGVTGEIIQIGIMRFHLREIKANDSGIFEPTGRVVTFPNSILFQPTAFYKYIDA